MSLFKALLTCRGRVCLPENTRADAFGRANPAPTVLVEIILIGNIVQVGIAAIERFYFFFRSQLTDDVR